MRVMVHAVGHRPAKRVFLYLNVALSGGLVTPPIEIWKKQFTVALVLCL